MARPAGGITRSHPYTPDNSRCTLQTGTAWLNSHARLLFNIVVPFMCRRVAGD